MMIDKTFGDKIDGANYQNRKGSYLIAIEDNMLAVVQTSKGYFLLGGGLEEKENHLDCIKRECIEEIGYEAFIQDYIGCAEEFYVHKELGYLHLIQFYYGGKISNKVSEPIESDHIFKWVSVDNIEQKMYLKAQGWAVKNYLLGLAQG